MPTFEIGTGGAAVIRHDNGTVEEIAAGDIAARYAALAGERGAAIDEGKVLEALRAHLARGTCTAQSSPETTQFPESETHTCCPSE
jgi:hypothetical protein